MDVNIKKYETIKKKNLFLDTEPKIKNKNRIIRNYTYKTKDECTSITTDSSSSHKKERIKKVTQLLKLSGSKNIKNTMQ